MQHRDAVQSNSRVRNMFFAEDDDAAAGEPTAPEAEAADCMRPVFDSDIMPVPRDEPEQRVGAAAAAAQATAHHSFPKRSCRQPANRL